MITCARFPLAMLVWQSLAYAITVSAGRESAWNGYVPPSSDRDMQFTPYYVPPGAKAYDANSPLLEFSGRWITSYSPSYAHHTSRWTPRIDAYVLFSFRGNGIEGFGTTSDTISCARIYIDGVLLETIKPWSEKTLAQQRIFWTFDLAPDKHTIKIINCGPYLDISAFVVTNSKRSSNRKSPAQASQVASLPRRDTSVTAAWRLTQKGSTGVEAMQIAIVSYEHAIIIDKVEHNPLAINGHPAWAALYNLKTHSVRPLAMDSNSFCAGGSYLSNGTMINVGGNPVVEDRVGAASFGDLNGLQSIRLFGPCNSGSSGDCAFYENHDTLHMASPRWYNTVTRLTDGSAIIVGGSKKGGWINNATVNNPTVEFYPPKNIHGYLGLPIPLPFLQRTLNSNLFPIVFLLPDGTLFIAANRDAIIYDWKTNSERALPQLPNGVRVTYPMTGAGQLLPLDPDTNYAPEILICGGSTIDDRLAGYELSALTAASSQCSRMVLTDEGISKGWQVEHMPEGRVMLDIVTLPTGQLLIVNGAGSGISGYGNVQHQVGQSNAANPRFTPVLYDPRAPKGERFSTKGLPTSDIPRLYHSVATLTPDGSVMIAGSNPNLDRSEMKYGTEYRVEWLNPPYMAKERPTISPKHTKNILYGQTFDLHVSIPNNLDADTVKFVMMDLGFITHSVHANSRLVYLKHQSSTANSFVVSGPKDEGLYPPGPAWLAVVVDGVPSQLVGVMVGDGHSPPVDEAAIANVRKTVKAAQTPKSNQDDTAE
ncbi:hypothetical protein PLEOSDRAFT_152955 [Pleurotus ostreatus PC15]|uniref:Glyoxal oxidase n=1 Tax=Pleurotus ostreatus (strain PC15) TaxID=1137138 RepID=A0A067PBY7_PLEO1|nr:hypothetical protein PLEOSDRAFT_152955 [Pleurotus ostreatus PC15]